MYMHNTNESLNVTAGQSAPVIRHVSALLHWNHVTATHVQRDVVTWCRQHVPPAGLHHLLALTSHT